MAKFKVGDKVVVVNEASVYGNYDNGDEGIVEEVTTPAWGYVRRTDGLLMNVYWTEIKHSKQSEVLSNAFDQAVEEVGEIFVAKSLIGKETEMNAEQIRDEILRICVRIEEAKKDIENAEKERDSLVEKLRKMGFEMLEQGVPDTRRPEVGDEVVVIGYSEAHHDCDYTGLVGTLDHDDRTARPYKVFLDKTGQSHWFAENEIKKI